MFPQVVKCDFFPPYESNVPLIVCDVLRFNVVKSNLNVPTVIDLL